MSFIQRELDRVTGQMLRHETGSPEWREHYAAQQALAWVIEPNGFRAPSNALSGRPVEDDVLNPLPGGLLPAMDCPSIHEAGTA